MLAALTAAGRQAPGPAEQDAEDEQGARAPHGGGLGAPSATRPPASPRRATASVRSPTARPRLTPPSSPPNTHHAIVSLPHGGRLNAREAAERAGQRSRSGPPQVRLPPLCPAQRAAPRQSGRDRARHSAPWLCGGQTGACGSQELQQDSCDPPSLNRTHSVPHLSKADSSLHLALAFLCAKILILGESKITTTPTVPALVHC